MNLKVITMSPLFALSEKWKRKRRHFQKFNSANIGFYSVRPAHVKGNGLKRWYGDIEFVWFFSGAFCSILMEYKQRCPPWMKTKIVLVSQDVFSKIAKELEAYQMNLCQCTQSRASLCNVLNKGSIATLQCLQTMHFWRTVGILFPKHLLTSGDKKYRQH